MTDIEDYGDRDEDEFISAPNKSLSLGRIGIPQFSSSGWNSSGSESPSPRRHHNPENPNHATQAPLYFSLGRVMRSSSEDSRGHSRSPSPWAFRGVRRRSKSTKQQQQPSLLDDHMDDGISLGRSHSMGSIMGPGGYSSRSTGSKKQARQGGPAPRVRPIIAERPHQQLPDVTPHPHFRNIQILATDSGSFMRIETFEEFSQLFTSSAHLATFPEYHLTDAQIRQAIEPRFDPVKLQRLIFGSQPYDAECQKRGCAEMATERLPCGHLMFCQAHLPTGRTTCTEIGCGFVGGPP